MASYYTPPPSSPFAVPNYPRPELYQRPPPTVVEQVQVDVCATATPTSVKSPGLSPCTTTTSTTSVIKVYKTFLQWKAESKATTADYLCNGFPSPVAWVYVEGHEIPPNAIIGGVDRKGPWHIARSFYEGSMELGKAARHLKLGACISFHGKERDVNLPTRWVYQAIQPVPVAPVPTKVRSSFADFKLVVLIDDSDSMDGGLWLQARDALAGVAEFSRQKGGESIDIYCLNNTKSSLDVRSELDVRNFFDSISPDGQTPLGAKLRQILDIYVPRIEDPSLNHKPISILVITDGRPTDDPRQPIVDFARRLDERQVPLQKFGLQFVQIGDDPDATEALKELDDELGPAHGVRDMVDTITFNRDHPEIHTEFLVKVLIGPSAI
ncbi:hypothetical protein EI94DRAFT_1696604 [Lactarius quietus]|nr:hypothetical protein EI94DRAFT_1696604 [Lactarius quietus]